MITAEQKIEQIREKHINDIYNAIDTILVLEEYYPLSSILTHALDKLNSLRSTAEEEIEEGDEVYDVFNKKYGEIKHIGAINYQIETKDGDYMIGKKFCFKV